MKTMEKKSVFLKGTQSALAPCWPGHEFSYFEKSSPQPEINANLEFRLNFCIFFYFHLCTENVFLSVLLLIL